MYKSNVKHCQKELFDWDVVLPNKDRLHKSIWHTLRTQVFEKVDESRFKVLYPSSTGRPNSPINEILTLMTIKELFDWSFRELESHMEWNFGLLYSCGVNIGESTVTLRTITSFIKSLREYFDKTSIDLFDLEFNRLVKDHLKTFRVNTRIARTDSTYINTNVCAYNRLQLQIEAIKRLYRILEEDDKVKVSILCPDYIEYEADNYVSMLKTEEISGEFQNAGICFMNIIDMVGDKYLKSEEWQEFIRIYQEQFTIKQDNDDGPKIEKKPSKEMTSNDIRGIDDPEATLRHKSGQNYLGFVGNVVETSDPEADLNLICDAVLYKNNVSDGQILTDRIDDLVDNRLEKLDEIHFDGGYGGPELDKKLKKHSVKSIQTGIRGVKCDVRMLVIEEADEYYASCVCQQKVRLQKTGKGYKAAFSPSVCSNCKKLNECSVSYKEKNNEYVYYVNDNDLNKRIRLSNISTIPEERRTIRSGVEATIHQFKCKTKANKSRLRGRYRHQLWFQLAALAINIKRIFNYTTNTPKNHESLGFSTFSSLFRPLLALIWDFEKQIGSFHRFQYFLSK